MERSEKYLISSWHNASFSPKGSREEKINGIFLLG
jgi:hypothetical protein